jgi:response regulator of citrate/malate metabolism
MLNRRVGVSWAPHIVQSSRMASWGSMLRACQLIRCVSTGRDEGIGFLPTKERPMAVLLTAYDRFAIRAFEIHALDYLLKPIDDERFAEALDRARQALALHRHRLHAGGVDGLLAARADTPAYARRFTVRIGHPITFVDVVEIDWIEAAGDYAGLHVSGEVHLVREPLHQLAERAYMTWMAARSPDEIKAMQEYGAAMRALFRSLQDLREKRIEPAAPEAQALITEWNTLAVRYGLRQFMTTLLEWNPAVAQKWLQVGERALSLSMASQEAAPDDGLWAYFGAAQQASPWHQALGQNADEAAKLVDSKVDPSSAPALALADRLARICSDHSLGDPAVYARWTGAMQFRSSADENVRKKSAWGYLASAFQAHLPRAASHE